METTVTESGPFEHLVTFRIPETRLDQAKNQAARKLSRSMKIPGFRPGRAPRRVVEAAVGPDRLRAEAIDEVLPEVVGDALASTDLEAAAVPAVQRVTDVDGGLEIEVKVATWPRLASVPDYVGREVEVDSPHVGDEEIAEQVERFRDQFAELEPVERPVEDGDYATVDLSAAQDGRPIEAVAASELMVPVGAGALIEGLDAAILGLSAGDSTTFEARIPEAFGDHGGESATFTVSVKGVHAKKLPDLTDEWVQEITEYGTAAALEAELRRRMHGAKLAASWNSFGSRLVDRLLDEVDIEIPEGIVTGEMEEILHRFSHTLAEQEIEMDDYLRLSGQTEAQFVDDLRQTALRNIRTELLLDAIAEDAGLAVDDEEVEALVAAAAGEGDRDPASVRESLSGAQVKKLRGDILRRKAHDSLLKAAVPVDDSGAPIDFDALAAAAAPPEPEGSTDDRDGPAAAGDTAEITSEEEEE